MSVSDAVNAGHSAATDYINKNLPSTHAQIATAALDVAAKNTNDYISNNNLNYNVHSAIDAGHDAAKQHIANSSYFSNNPTAATIANTAVGIMASTAHSYANSSNGGKKRTRHTKRKRKKHRKTRRHRNTKRHR
jgi:hypothetical protein